MIFFSFSSSFLLNNYCFLGKRLSEILLFLTVNTKLSIFFFLCFSIYFTLLSLFFKSCSYSSCCRCIQPISNPDMGGNSGDLSEVAHDAGQDCCCWKEGINTIVSMHIMCLHVCTWRQQGKKKKEQ